jgi:hypothetical protein
MGQKKITKALDILFLTLTFTVFLTQRRLAVYEDYELF